jgi:hypothetical protein
MKHLVAAWLLVGLSLGVPQFGKGEVAGQGSLDEGRAGSTFGNAAQGATVGPQCVHGVRSATKEAMLPGYPAKVLAKSVWSAPG